MIFSRKRYLPQKANYFILVKRSRGVAQLGSASALGAEGRWFESSHPDHLFCAAVVQLVEHQPSKLIVAGSSPVRRSIFGVFCNHFYNFYSCNFMQRANVCKTRFLRRWRGLICNFSNPFNKGNS